MVYQPNKEYLFNRILWTAFLPAICTIIVLKFWNPSGISHNIFWLAGLLLAWFLFANTVWAWVQVYRCKLFLDQKGLGLSIGAEELKKIEWKEISTIGVWEVSTFFIPSPALVVKSRTNEFAFNLSVLSKADCQKLKKELTAKLGPNGISPAFE